MKVAIVFCIVVAVALAAKSCHDVKECSCPHPDQTPNCENHLCVCVDHGGKRAEHTCTTDADCAAYECHGHGTPFCSHHGSAEHGHSLCACNHA